MANTNQLKVIYGDGTLGVGGDDFHYIFNYGRGGIESLVIGGKEWCYREPKPRFGGQPPITTGEMVFR